MRKLVVTLFAVAISYLSPVAHAADEIKASVAVRHAGDDRIGQKLAFALREVVRASHGYQLVSGPSALFRVSLNTIDPEYETKYKGIVTVAAVIITMRNFNEFEDGNPQTWYPIYLNSSVLMVGSDRVEDFAKSILADVDSAIEAYRADARRKE